MFCLAVVSFFCAWYQLVLNAQNPDSVKLLLQSWYFAMFQSVVLQEPTEFFLKAFGADLVVSSGVVANFMAIRNFFSTVD